MLSGLVDSSVEELLKKEENKGLLDGLGKASERVERAKRELAEIQRQEIQVKQMRDYISQLESRTSEIAECQKEILEAKAMVEEAQRSLSTEDEEMNKTEGRIESAKAAFIAASVGTLAGLPIYLTQASDNSLLILPLVVAFISCALFGVTYRYAVRRDLDDFHLKTGAAAAFGVVKGLAILEGGPPLELEMGSLVSHAINGAVCVSENILIFGFAAVAMDFCFKTGVLSPFPIQKSASETNK